MLTIGSLAFAQPLMLALLAGLPVLWWLLRVTPPSPRVIAFPGMRFLRDLVHREETPARTPWWLIVLRLILATVLIIALSQPLLNPSSALHGSGPVTIVIDNGWAAGPGWSDRQDAASRIIERASRGDRQIRLVTTSPDGSDSRVMVSDLLRPVEAERRIQALTPVPWPVDHTAAAEALDALEPADLTEVYWISHGLQEAGTPQLAEALSARAATTILGDDSGAGVLLAGPIDRATGGFQIQRADDRGEREVRYRALGQDGRFLFQDTVTMADGERRTLVDLDLPLEMRNAVTRVVLDDVRSAGGTLLLDSRWQRQPVGLVSGGDGLSRQPLLSDLHYLQRAFEPFAEARTGTIRDLLTEGISTLVLSDIGTIGTADFEMVSDWIEDGGVLVRFAGPRLAEGSDGLLPARLRMGDRSLGGTISWSEPLSLGEFSEDSPFSDLAVPDDVTVTRQVLAEPSPDLDAATWARLEDGTPLVTGSRSGDGWLILVHTTATPDWSDLVLSGVFVEMMRSISDLAIGSGAARRLDGSPLPAVQTLDGFGQLTQPPAHVRPIEADRLSDVALGPRHPPGYYGPENQRLAFNLADATEAPARLADLPSSIARAGFDGAAERSLMPWLLTAGLVLMIVDLLASLAMRGLIPGMRSRRPSARRANPTTTALLLSAAIGLAVYSGPGTSAALANDDFALRAANDTYLAYVITGDAETDRITRAGMEGLSRALGRRTSVEPAGAIGVDPASDELAFFPLLYWSVPNGMAPPGPDVVERLNRFLRQGGTIFFDTRDGRSGGNATLAGLANALDIPALAPVPSDHVVTKAFYLLQEFPGRHADGELWVEAEPTGAHDGVSPVIVGGNDWVGAWAIDEQGRPMFPVSPGGERQRELAFRTGINLVMYALTGSYKEDQVHVSHILERLSQ